MVRRMRPLASSSRSVCVSIFCEMPSPTRRRSSLLRTGPFSSAGKMRSAHLPATSSSARVDGQAFTVPSAGLSGVEDEDGAMLSAMGPPERDWDTRERTANRGGLQRAPLSSVELALADVLGVKVIVQPVNGAFPAVAGFLHAAKRCGLRGQRAFVDADDAGLQRFSHAPDATHVLAIEISG